MKDLRSITLLLIVVLVLQSPLIVAASTLSQNTIEQEETQQTEDNLKEVAADSESDETAAAQEAAREALLAILEQKPVYVLLYNTVDYQLKTEPGEETGTAGTVESGAQLQIEDVAFTDQGGVYYLVTGSVDGNEVEGYVEGSYLATNDAEFNDWKENELTKVTGLSYQLEISNLESIYINFPSGYWSYLTALSESHPNWVFVPLNTGLEWSDVVSAQCQGTRSLVYKTADDSWKSKASGDYDSSTGQYIAKSGSNWFHASEYAVSYCLNPLNYLNENYIFAFEQLTYNQSVHNSSGVAAIIANSWMNGSTLEDGSGGLYQDVFVEIGSKTGVSPYHLASRVLQEQGTQGTAKLISGYEGVYNYFNVQASGSTEEEILANGTAYAKAQGWTTRYLSLLGGAANIGEKYISKGQDSLYLQKFDVDNSYYGLYTHQYMQNIQAPMTESVSVKRAYSNAGALDNNYVFKIPVYLNMPGNTDSSAVDSAGAEKFITQLYATILDRNPDADGLAYWKAKLASGSTAADLIVGFFDSTEMQGKNLSNETYLDYAYRAILGREADTDGKNYWLAELNAGCTRKYILTGFVESTEFQAMCAKYGITKGSITALSPADKNAGQTKFVVRLYRNILNREADEAGLNDWTNRLQNGLSACELVEGFVYSREFLASDLSNEQYVDILYKTLLGREADSAGRADWVGQLNSGASRSKILAGFAYSTEFGSLCSQYGIKVGALTR